MTMYLLCIAMLYSAWNEWMGQTAREYDELVIPKNKSKRFRFSSHYWSAILTNAASALLHVRAPPERLAAACSHLVLNILTSGHMCTIARAHYSAEVAERYVHITRFLHRLAESGVDLASRSVCSQFFVTRSVFSLHRTYGERSG